MERQLSVWAAPGVILCLALLAFVFGHPPRSAAPHGAIEVAAAPEAPPVQPPSEPQQLPKAQPKSPKPAELKPDAPPAKAEPKPAEPASAPPAEQPEPDQAPPTEAVVKTGDGPAGKIVGRIVFEGAPPAPRAPTFVPEKQVAECCAAEMDTSDRSLLVAADGGVADVVVTIKAKGAEAAGHALYEMDQKCCVFTPRVLLVPVHASVVFKNSDGATHNVHIDARKNADANNNLAAGSTMKVAVDKDDEMTITCDIHTWMKGYVIVSKYATACLTGSDGRFEIDGVPPGEWAVDIWSERTKPLDKKLKVKVEPGATTTVEWRVAAGD